MSPLGLPSLDRISALPADVLGALRMIPEIAENTRAMRDHTAALTRVADALDRVAADTEALPALRGDMARVSETTRVLGGMDARMATIEEAMPVLLEVQRHLAQLPETMGRLDRGIEGLDQGIKRLSGLMERIPDRARRAQRKCRHAAGSGRADGPPGQPRTGAEEGLTARRSRPGSFYRLIPLAESFDTIVIGGGPGGYVAAIRSAQLGRKTAVVERDKAGGRCLNYACIPAKTILRTAEIYTEARESADLGVVANDVSLDWDAVHKRRAAVSDSLSSGVKMLWDKNKVTVIEGEGSLTPDGNVEVGEKTYEAGAVVLATGSVALPIPGVEFGGRVVDTWGAWSLPEVPKKIAVVGAGASGCEIASAYGRFGTEVLLIEMLPQILPAEDKDVVRVVERAFKKQNITVATGYPVENVEASEGSVKLTYGGESAEVDYLCVAGGRGADTGPLGLQEAGIELEENGKVKVDEFQRTSNPKVYAIGDLVSAKALAHKASEEGVVAAEHAAGAETHPVDQNLVAGATFSHPQVASVGLTEAAAKEAGSDVKVGKLKLGAVGGATVYDDKDGLVKIVADSKYGEILGVHIVGNRACDMIAELVATMALEGGYQELARIVHPHPTISEAIFEAARAVDGWATHA